MSVSSISQSSGIAPIATPSTTTSSIISQLDPQSSSSSADSVQISPQGQSLASQLVNADGTVNLGAAGALLQQQIDTSLFASLGGSSDSASFSAAGLAMSAGSTSDDAAQMFQLAATSEMVQGLPSNLTTAQLSTVLSQIGVQIPNLSSILQSPSTSAPATDSTAAVSNVSATS